MSEDMDKKNNEEGMNSLMKSGSFSNSVMDEIEKKRVHPLPRWRFTLRKGTAWALYASSSALGALAVAVMLFVAEHAGFSYRVATHDTVLAYVFDLAPLFWVTALCLGAGVAFFEFRNTPRGYRIPTLVVVGTIALASIAGGFVLNATGVGRLAEDIAGSYVPFHRPIWSIQEDIWIRPERGLLAGTITSRTEGMTSFVLEAFDGREWTVDARELRERDREVMETDGTVRVIGLPYTSSSTSSFHACAVFPWNVPEPRQNGHRGEGRMRRLVTATPERNISLERTTTCEDLRIRGVLGKMRQ